MIICFSSKTNKLANKVLDYLREPSRWAHDGYWHQNAKCIVMSISKEANELEFEYPYKQTLRLAVRKAIEEQYGDFYSGSVITFNDHKNTTHEDVVRVLERAEVLTRPIWKRMLQCVAKQ